jgi:hypothetical protein
MPLTNEAKARALLAALAGPLYVSLLDRNGAEPDYPGFVAQPVALSAPKADADGTWMESEGEVRFSAVTKAQERACVFWVLRDATGEALASDELEEPRLLRAGEVPVLPPGAIRVGLR